MKENFHVKVFVNCKDDDIYPENVQVDAFDIVSEPKEALRTLAKIMVQTDSSFCEKGLIFRIENQKYQAECFERVNSVDSSTKESTFYIRSAWKEDKTPGFEEAYIDTSEKRVYLVYVNPDKNKYQAYKILKPENQNSVYTRYEPLGGCDESDEFNVKRQGWTEYKPKTFWFKYEEKIAKGYEDRSEEIDFQYDKNGNEIQIQDENGNTVKVADKEKEALPLITEIVGSRNDTVLQNFNIQNNLCGSNAQKSTMKGTVTQKAIDNAKASLANLVSIASSQKPDIEEFKKEYQKLVTIVPRKISNLKSYISNVSDNPKDKHYIGNIVQEEQALLMNLESAYQHTLNGTEEQGLSKYGLEFRPTSFAEKFQTLKELDANGNRFNQFQNGQAHMVTDFITLENQKCRQNFEDYVKAHNVQNNEIKHLWHGCAKKNAWSILTGGLQLRYANTCGMYGAGLYFSNEDRATKACGYTGTKMAAWKADCSEAIGYLMKTNVIMQNPYLPMDRYGCNFRSYADLPNGTDSVAAFANNTGLVNDEFIIYREEQHCIQEVVRIDEDIQPYPFRMNDLLSMEFEKTVFKKIDINGKQEMCVVAEVKDDSYKKAVLGNRASYIAVPINEDTKPVLLEKQSDGSFQMSDFRKDAVRWIGERYMETLGTENIQQFYQALQKKYQKLCQAHQKSVGR